MSFICSKENETQFCKTLELYGEHALGGTREFYLLVKMLQILDRRMGYPTPVKI